MSVTELCSLLTLLAHSWLRVTGNHKYSGLRQALMSQATQWVTYNSLSDKVPGQPWAGTPVRLRTLTEKTETGQKRLTLAGGISDDGAGLVCWPSAFKSRS